MAMKPLLTQDVKLGVDLAAEEYSDEVKYIRKWPGFENHISAEAKSWSNTNYIHVQAVPQLTHDSEKQR